MGGCISRLLITDSSAELWKKPSTVHLINTTSLASHRHQPDVIPGASVCHRWRPRAGREQR